ncbi:MAG: DUF58 domain-containing protein [Planctomycetota bacterium]
MPAPRPFDPSVPATADVALPSPTIAFPSSYLARIGRLRARWRAARERREGAGRAHLAGVGDEFVGFRPYRPGDDPRGLDWNLLARFDEPYVRISRREASERWTLVLDTSASMGVGRPGKLQRAAEVALAIASIGIAGRASVQLSTTDGARPLAIARPADLLRAMTSLERRRAAGRRGLASWLQAGTRAGRLILLGDFLDLAATELRVGRGRELMALAFLAPEEFVPARAALPGESAVWVDAESGERRTRTYDRASYERYEQALAQHLEAWRRAAVQRRASFDCWSTEDAFERVVERTLGF